MTAKTEKSSPKKKDVVEKTNEEKINEIIAESGSIVKMEVDYSETYDEKIPKAEDLANQGKLSEALEMLTSLEKQTRTGADMHSTSESDDEDLILPDPDGRGGVVKVEIPASPDVPLVYPKEPLKTLLAFVWLVFGWVASSSSLALTHERVPDIDPLPDIVLDNVPYQQWGLDVSEILIMVSIITEVLVVLLHSHRWIILRRIFFLWGLIFYYRAITMYVTVLPKADTNYTCAPKQNTTTAYEIADRVLKIMSGGGLSINGKHVYCGDYIFSGHTVALTMGYYAIRDYSPGRFFLLHWVSLCMSVAGVILLMLARGHYSVDVIIAYWVTTRLWWQYHTLANNNSLKRRGQHNVLSEIWWWVIFRYFENKIPGPLPHQYNLPIPDFVSNLICRKKSTDELDTVSQV